MPCSWCYFLKRAIPNPNLPRPVLWSCDTALVFPRALGSRILLLQTVEVLLRGLPGRLKGVAFNPTIHTSSPNSFAPLLLLLYIHLTWGHTYCTLPVPRWLSWNSPEDNVIVSVCLKNFRHISSRPSSSPWDVNHLTGKGHKEYFTPWAKRPP